jgi:hypothetical protein
LTQYRLYPKKNSPIPMQCMPFVIPLSSYYFFISPIICFRPLNDFAKLLRVAKRYNPFFAILKACTKFPQIINKKQIQFLYF